MDQAWGPEPRLGEQGAPAERLLGVTSEKQELEGEQLQPRAGALHLGSLHAECASHVQRTEAGEAGGSWGGVTLGAQQASSSADWLLTPGEMPRALTVWGSLSLHPQME